MPLALAGLIDGFDPFPGQIIILEPRRIAARMAARRMAETLGEKLGQSIGLSTRVDRHVSAETKVEVVTDGLFTRRLLSDPELSGISAVIFDEIHERSLSADLGLALAVDTQTGLREDLHLLAMSATLDTVEIATKLSAPVLESGGRQYPIETRYLGRRRDRIEPQMADAISRALRETDGSILAFLPGAGEIRRTAERLEHLEGVRLAPLYGALSPAEQEAAIARAPDGERKVVLATDIAESALTIEGVSIVIDSGYARVPRFVPGGLSTDLQTVRAARANVDQRRGRAGRLGPGICYRLWDEAETRGLQLAPDPEILNADLSGLVLTLADWGERDPSRLTWLTPPPLGRLESAVQDLIALGALTPNQGLTAKGKAMARLPLAPRLSALIAGAETAGERALGAQIAALMSERGLGGSSDDLSERLHRFRADRSARARTLRAQAKRWAGSDTPTGDPATLLAKAWPDRIARKRAPGAEDYLLAGGRAGRLDEMSGLNKSPWLVVADLIGSAKTGRITLAAPISEQDALRVGTVETQEDAEFDADKNTIKARRTRTLGAIILSEQPLPKPKVQTANAAFLKHISSVGFEPTGLASAVNTFLARARCLHDVFGEPWPTWTQENLQASVETWLAPILSANRFEVPSEGTITHALKAQFDWQLASDFDQYAPIALELPSGRRAKVDWLDERAPLIECRAQDLYGASQHLSVAGSRVPVTLQILSPGGKPVATTRDLPAFWSTGYHDMAKDMRGRYPKHDWPEDPVQARPHPGLTKARLAQN